MIKDSRLILVDKPVGWTSFDVVAKIRGKIKHEYITCDIKPTKKQLKVGHAGTLDPFASGLLIILIGDECQKAGEFLKLDKCYEFTAKLGEVSTTADPEGEVTSLNNKTQAPINKDVEQVLKQFTGEITQIPPAYSAIKVEGKRAYKLAREGKKVHIPPRKVTVYSIELLEYKYPYLKCICKVSSGTYIRTLVEDIGKKLNTGAYCTELRRTQIGGHRIQDARELTEV